MDRLLGVVQPFAGDPYAPFVWLAVQALAGAGAGAALAVKRRKRGAA